MSCEAVWPLQVHTTFNHCVCQGKDKEKDRDKDKERDKEKDKDRDKDKDKDKERRCVHSLVHDFQKRLSSVVHRRSPNILYHQFIGM